MNIPSLPESLQAFVQVLMSRKVMSHEEAKVAMEKSYKFFGDVGLTLNEAISEVDKTLACIDMGVRSMKANGREGGIYHCLVNKSADEVAKLHGSKLLDWQVEVFKGIITFIGSSVDGRLTLADIVGLKAGHKNVNNEQILSFANHLVKEFWLARPENSAYYKLGVRSYVELPELLKSYNLTVPQVIHH